MGVMSTIPGYPVVIRFLPVAEWTVHGYTLEKQLILPDSVGTQTILVPPLIRLVLAPPLDPHSSATFIRALTLA